MTPKYSTRITHPLALLLYIGCILASAAQRLQSPCPEVFSYQQDARTNEVYGHIELSNLRVGQTVKLHVMLALNTRLSSSYVGSITLIKSRDDIFNDVLQGAPVQYKVNFPLQNFIPTVRSITVNGQTICTGYQTQSTPLTTINLEHTLYTQLQSQGGVGQGLHYNNAPDNNLLIYRPQPEVSPFNTQSRPQPEYIYEPQINTVPQPVRPQQNRPTFTRPIARPDVGGPEVAPPQFTRPEAIRPGSNRPEPIRPEVTESRPTAVRTTVAPPISSLNFTCGKPSTKFLQRLTINGELVDKGQFPWIVPLFDRQPRNPKYICGSTIITKKHLITAAHCVYEADDFLRPERILAVPGMYNIDNFFDDNAEFADVEEVLAHDEYVHDDDLNDADVAVLRLKSELQYTDYVIPICPWQGENDLSRIVGQEGFVAGWGITENGMTTVPTFIKTVIVDRRQCSLNLARMYASNSRIFCGDGRGSAPCNGDSGSGLVVKRGNQYYLRGVVSKGQVDANTLKCDVTKYAIYTDIAPFRFWLKSVTN